MSTRTYVALLRGINVGRAKRVAMGDLRRVMNDLGYGNVRTLLNSGNVVFETPAGAGQHAAGRIERAIEEELGVTSRVTTLSASDLDSIIAENPLAETPEPSRHFVAFPNEPADLEKLESVHHKDWAPERLALGKRAAYLWCPTGAIDSALAKEVSRVMGDGVTMRNWATTLKIQVLARD